MEFRIRLGERVTGPELITNGDFSAGFASWITGGGTWSIVGGAADFVSAGAGYGSLEQLSVLTAGARYRLEYDRLILQVDPEATTVRLGDWGTGPEPQVIATHRIDRTILTNTNMNINFQPHMRDRIDNITLKELTFNDPLIANPKGLDKIKINIELDESIYGLFKRFPSDLEFVDDGYDFITNVRDNEGRCGEIRTLVEVKCDPLSDWEDLFEGVITIKDCQWNQREKLVKATIEEESVQAILARGKRQKIYVANTNSDTAFLPNAATTINPHDAAGNRVYGTRLSYDLFTVWRRVVMAISDIQIDFESDLFSSGTFDEMQISFGTLIASGAASSPAAQQEESFSLSFEQLFEACNAVWDIGFIITENSAGNPVIKVERKSDLRSNTILLTLDNVDLIGESYDVQKLYKTTSIGYAKIFDSDNSDGVQFITQDTCSTEDLQIISNILQDSQIIFGILDLSITSGDYDEDWFFFQCTLVGGTNYDTDKFGATSLYNGDIDVEDNITRWVEDLPGNQKRLREAEGALIIEKTNDPLDVINEISAELSFTQFKTIVDFTEQIAFNNPQKNIDKQGLILTITYDPKGVSDFKLLST